MKYCAACGYRLPDFERECPLCGGRLKNTAGDQAAPVHTHREAGEQCILPNQRPSPAPAQKPVQQRRPAVGKASPGKVVLLVLAVIFGLNALRSGLLFAALFQGEALGMALFYGILAEMFYRLSRIPRGCKTVTMKNGRQVPLGTMVFSRVVLAILRAAVFGSLFR